MKYDKIVIGVDQSYTKTGISVCADGKLIMVKSINFKGLKARTDKRNEVRRVLTKLLKKASGEALQTLVICERIRTNSPTKKSKKDFGIRPDYLKMTGALISVIVDTAYEFNVETYSVDTRSWKAQVVGTSKADKDGNTKMPTVKYVQQLGFDLFIRTDKNGKDVYDDDAADSACIALYGFISDKLQKLKLEE